MHRTVVQRIGRLTRSPALQSGPYPALKTLAAVGLETGADVFFLLNVWVRCLAGRAAGLTGSQTESPLWN